MPNFECRIEERDGNFEFRGEAKRDASRTTGSKAGTLRVPRIRVPLRHSNFDYSAGETEISSLSLTPTSSAVSNENLPSSINKPCSG
jgi:hypothetical protein